MDDRNHQTFRHGAGLRRFCPADGSSNVLSHGSVAVAGSQRISKRQSPAPLPGHSLRTSEPSPGDSQELEVKCNHYESDTKAARVGSPATQLRHWRRAGTINALDFLFWPLAVCGKTTSPRR